MKLALIIAAASAEVLPEHEIGFMNFVAVHNKVYQTREEFVERMDRFAKVD